MTYVSFFSGCLGADIGLEAAGHTPLAYCEIDRQCRDVIRFRKPDVPCHDDVTTFDTDAFPCPDFVWMSPPCQDLSVAGKRAGLSGERSGLFYESLKLIGRMRPQWVLMEQVPGLLSSNEGDDFFSVLEGMDELRYVCDCDIIDSQHFGVPQRRKRIYFAWQSIESIQQKKTLTSAITILQCLAEMSLLVLAAHQPLLPSELQNLAFDASNAADGLVKRMRLFGLPSENKVWSDLLDYWEEQASLSQRDERNSAWGDGRRSPEEPRTNKVTSSCKANGKQGQTARSESYSCTARSWNGILDELCEEVSASTTSTGTSPITGSAIYSCALIAEHTASLICRLSDCSPNYFQAALSALTTIRAYTNYARQATCSPFEEVERLQPWFDFTDRISRLEDALLRTRIRSWGEILALAQGLRGDSPPSRTPRERVAASLTAGSHPGSAPGRRREDDENLVPALAGTLGSHKTGGWGMELDNSGAFIPIQEVGKRTGSGGSGQNGMGIGSDGDPMFSLLSSAQHGIAHALTGNGFDASEDGTGRGTPIVPVAFGWNKSESQTMRVDNATTDALPASSTSNPAVAFEPRYARNGRGTPSDIASPLKAESGQTGKGDGATCVASAMSVRRLTPLECERLQSFPDEWTRWGKTEDGKVYEMADGPRYRMCGNAVTSNVAKWIGQRLESDPWWDDLDPEVTG